METTKRTKAPDGSAAAPGECDPTCGEETAAEAGTDLEGKLVGLSEEHAPEARGEDAPDADEDEDEAAEDALDAPDAMLAAAVPPGRLGRVWYATLGGIALVAVTATLWSFNSPPENSAAKRRVAQVAAMPEVRLSLPTDGLRGTLGQALAVPVQVAARAGIPDGSFALVRGVPERAMLSSGQPFGAGTWRVQPDELSRLSLTIFAGDQQPAHIAVELLTAGGRVMARTETTVAAAAAPLAETRPRQTDRAEATTYPPLKAERSAEAGERAAPAERAESPVRGNRKAARAPEPRSGGSSASAKPRLNVAGAQPQPPPKSKSAWTMNWNSLSYSR